MSDSLGRPCWRLTRCALLAALAVATGCDRGDSVVAPSEQQAPPPNESHFESLAHWSAGQRYLYELAMSSVASLGDKGEFLSFDTSGIWQVDVRQVDAGGAVLEVAIIDASMTTPDQKGALDEVAAELAGPYAIELDTNGTIAALRIPEGAHSVAVGVVRTIASALQVAGGTGDDWKAKEFDNTGRYEAHYALLEEGRVRKTKQRFLNVLTKVATSGRTLPFSPHAKVLSSKTNFEFKSDQLAKLALDEQISVATSEKAPETRLKLVLTLALKKRERAPAATQDLDALTKLPASEPYLVDVSAGLAAARAGDYTLEKTLDELKALGAPTGEDDPNADARARLFSALRGIFARDDAAIAKGIERAKRGNELTQPVLLRALAQSGNPDAQAALVRLMQGAAHSDPKLFKSLVVDVSFIEKPTDDSSAALVALMGHPVVGTQATYGVGMHIRQLYGRKERKRADALLRLLTSPLEGARHDGNAEILLRAIANSSHPGALPAITPFISSKSAAVRLAAVQALRNIQDPRVDPLLMSAMRDADKDVRKAAAKVAGRRSGSASIVESLGQLMKSEKNDHARFAALRSLIRLLPTTPRARPILETVAASDPQEYHREAAQKALEAATPSPVADG